MRATRTTEAPFALPAPGDAAARRLPRRGLADVRRHIECDGTPRCQRLARQVADQVRAQLPP